LTRLARLLLTLVVAGGLLVASAVPAIWFSWNLHSPYAEWTGDHVDVMLEPGLGAGEMLRRLGRAGVLRHPGMLRAWLSVRGGAESLQAGEYRFESSASALEVLKRLQSGDVLLHAVTIPEGLTLVETAELLATAGFGEAHEFTNAFTDPTPIHDFDPAAKDLEGYLFPETYRFPRSLSPDGIAQAMLDRFRAAVGDDYAERSRAVDLDLHEAVALASMIEKETSRTGERRRISRVFHNRLSRGMRLQCDPTVIYALRRAGHPVTRLSKKQLDFDSPWNTYQVYGLPPGPIASPGLASLQAAVDPTQGRELYFVAAPGGGHRFSDTLDAHLQAVAAWRNYLRSSR
jgi:UPF0755 protein